MEKLLEYALKAAEQAEVTCTESQSDRVGYQNAQLQSIDTSFNTTYRLRIIRDGKIGTAVSHNLDDRRRLVENAVASLHGNVKAEFSFPFTPPVEPLDAWSPRVAEHPNAEKVAMAEEICQRLGGKPGREISSGVGGFSQVRRHLNSKGTDLEEKKSTFSVSAALTFPGSASSVYRYQTRKAPFEIDATVLNEVEELFDKAQTTVPFEGGKMKVLFMPHSLVTLIWRLLAATSAVSVDMKTSPLIGKIGEQIIDPKLTIYDDPRSPLSAFRSGFDSDGMATGRFTLFDKGVLKGYYNNLKYATRLKQKPTATCWNGGPGLVSLHIEPGERSFEELVAMMDRGVILESAMGAHSGNITQGEYSVGGAAALYVENGQIKGRVKDIMIAGNAYETLNNVLAVGRDAQFGMVSYQMRYPGVMPPILCENVNIASRQ